MYLWDTVHVEEEKLSRCRAVLWEIEMAERKAVIMLFGVGGTAKYRRSCSRVGETTIVRVIGLIVHHQPIVDEVE